jgi:hypothetical protein
MCKFDTNNTRLLLTYTSVIRCGVTVQTEDKQQPVVEDQPIPENPEVIIFASYAGLPKAPVPISKLAEMVKCNVVMHHYIMHNIYHKNDDENRAQQ